MTDVTLNKARANPTPPRSFLSWPGYAIFECPACGTVDHIGMSQAQVDRGNHETAGLLECQRCGHGDMRGRVYLAVGPDPAGAT